MQPLTEGRIAVYTFKRGLLSKIAHDLRLRLERFELRADGEQLEGEFYVDSLLVEGAIKRGELDPKALSDSDRRDILSNVRREILDADRHPAARFSGKATPRTGGYLVSGELELRGRRAPIETMVESDGRRLRARLELVPSRWGIEPYQALLGAIKLQDRVIVELDFAAPG
jgi:polyisoprenoid-binding protein YceI